MSGAEERAASDEAGDNGPARRLLATLGSRFERRKAVAQPHVVLDNNSEALLILKNHEESGQGWFWATNAAGELTYLTESISKVLSPEAESLIGTSFSNLFSHGEDSAGNRRTLAFALSKRSKIGKLAVVAANADEERWWEVSGSPQFDKSGEFCGFRGSGTDVTEQRRSTEQASQMAMYDALTGLTNRRHMGQVLESTLQAFAHQNRSCSIMLIDLDRFKQVNDTLGHPAGDALLKQVAERLLKIIGDKEKVCRLGGDEFQIILPDSEDRGAIGDLAAHIISSLSQPYSVEGSRCVIGASVGIAVSPYDGSTSEEIVRNADLALYAAKGSGRGRFRFFSSDFLRSAEDKRVLEEDLRDAVTKGEMAMHYQPVVCAKTNCVTGVEALIRWNHPERGWISPALFIPIAEEANLIEQLGEFALRRACEDAARWPGKLRVAVNVSPIQFANEALPGIVKQALVSSGLPASRLELEITEGVFLSNSDETDDMFGALKQVGVRLALDDFGTGYSSLGYLRTAPFDKIKIDQSFVRGATEPGSRNDAIIAAIVALAEALDMDTTAEGIESLDQLALMRKLNVSHIQGFIYSKAVPDEDVRRMLEAGDWVIEPVGPARQRDDRQSVYRKATAVHEDHCYQIVIRNISVSGALMEGLVDVPVGTRFVIDLGEGQLAIATVRRSEGHQQGVEFDERLVSDGNGGLCTRHRVSQYLLALAGLPDVAGQNIGLSGQRVKGVQMNVPSFKAAKLWNSAQRYTEAA
ncbi:EAL domain-containing protein [Sphingomonas sp. SUN039]|uniref:sensor domain-containing protein n=1 Tax=Sphingomonas sp. SUN039 TaxID=2937787 RepID=UPI0021644EC5|nr:EAL domain-containing protein [Sphingomonas sp. SUN039]UVO53562.1 EAL domain-containing protein [Sphingomonas sp. SUN039]